MQRAPTFPSESDVGGPRTANDGFVGYVVAGGPEKIQVHFIGGVGLAPSWVLCEGAPEATCAFD